VTLTNIKMLSENDRKAELSFAWVAALAANEGFTVQRGPSPDVASVDVTIRTGSPDHRAIDVQLKATSRPSKQPDGLHFRLKRKNHDDLAAGKRSLPLVLVVLELPRDESVWLQCSSEGMILRKCGWWLSLAGREPLDSETTTVVLPRSQRFDESGLTPLFERVFEAAT